MRLPRIVGCLVAGLIALAGPAARAQATYTFTTIDPPGATRGAEAWGINAAGGIAGLSLTPTTFHGFVRSPAGTFTQIDVPGGAATGALGINGAGQVVGYYAAGNSSHGFLLSGGNYTALNAPGATNTIANGINAAGLVVGSYAPSAQYQHAFLWSAAGGYTAFDRPNATATLANGINDAGQTVGYFSDSAGTHGFLRSPAGVYTTIDAPQADPNFPNTLAYGVNNVGGIAGFFSDAVTGLDRGFVLSGGVYTTVDVPGAMYTHVFGINDAGQLVGVYGATLNDSHAFLATPVPEPAALPLAAVGSVALLRRRRTAKRWPQRSAGVPTDPTC
jgi:probable HAF family extracellular repeat protein